MPTTTLRRRTRRDVQEILRGAARSGFVTTRWLVAAGLAASTIHRLREHQAIQHIIGSVFHLHLERHQLSQLEWNIARALAHGDTARLGSMAGLAAYDYTRFTCGEAIEIVDHRRHRVAVPNVVSRTAAELARTPMRYVLGAPVPPIEWLIADLGLHLSKYQIANVVYRAQYHHRRLDFSIERLRELVATDRRPGIGVVRGALALNARRSAGTKSFAEDAYVDTAIAVAGREPTVNEVVRLGSASYEVDVGFPEFLVRCEIDGGQHGRDYDRDVDVLSDVRFDEYGWLVLRESSRAALRDRPGCGRRLRNALELQARRLGRSL